MYHHDYYPIICVLISIYILIEFDIILFPLGGQDPDG